MTPTAVPPPAPVAASRRGLLIGGAGAAALLAGCTATGGTRPDAAAPVPSTQPGALGAEDGAEDGAEEVDDAGLLAEAREAVAGVAALVVAARRSAPPLRATLAPLLALHEAHAEALGRPLEPVRARRRAAPPDPLLALVREREERLQERLTDLAVAVGSGALARLLASMSAGLSQRLAVLPTAAPGRGAGARTRS